MQTEIYPNHHANQIYTIFLAGKDKRKRIYNPNTRKTVQTTQEKKNITASLVEAPAASLTKKGFEQASRFVDRGYHQVYRAGHPADQGDV